MKQCSPPPKYVPARSTYYLRHLFRLICSSKDSLLEGYIKHKRKNEEKRVATTRNVAVYKGDSEVTLCTLRVNRFTADSYMKCDRFQPLIEPRNEGFLFQT